MPCVQLVLEKKGLCREAILRASNLYKDSVSIVIVNNISGRVIPNTRLSIRQGDKASMEWFTYGIDLVITCLEKRLTCILFHSAPVQGLFFNHLHHHYQQLIRDTKLLHIVMMSNQQ